MEFTISRCVLMLCGLVLMGVAVQPVSEYLSADEDGGLKILAQKDADLLDRCMDSGMDECILYGDRMMPDSSYSVVIDGNRLTLSDGGQTFTAYTRNSFERMVIGYGDIVSVVSAGTSAEE